MSFQIDKIVFAPKRPRKPIYIRLPNDKEYCPYTNLSRSTMIRIIKEPKNDIESILIPTSPKAKSGVRLINLNSLLCFLRYRCPKLPTRGVPSLFYPIKKTKPKAREKYMIPPPHIAKALLEEQLRFFECETKFKSPKINHEAFKA